MSDLCAVGDAQDLLGVPRSQDTQLLQLMIDRLDSVLAQLTGQLYLKGTTLSPVVLEPVNAPGRTWVWVRRPIATLTAVLVGQDKNNPMENMSVSDPFSVVVDARRPRRIVRTDGAIFPAGVSNVWVSYTPADNIPAGAAAALLEGVAFIYRRRGSEDAKAEMVNGFTHTLEQDLMKLPTWNVWVQRFRRPSIGMLGDTGGPVMPGTLWPYGTGVGGYPL